MLAAWSTSRRVKTGYAGDAFQARDSALVARNAGFTNGVVDVSAFPTYGDGTTFTAGILYDQVGNKNFTSSSRPVLKLGMLVTNEGRVLPGIDFQAKSQNMVTATGQEFLNFGGTADFTMFLVFGTFGWSSSGTHARSPAVYSNANGPVFGFGTTLAGALVFGAQGNTNYAPGETNVYGKSALALEEGTPDNTRIRTFWIRQQGGLVSAGCGSTIFFKDRPHGVAASGLVRAVLGNAGNLNQSHNGPFFEGVMFGAALPIRECQQLALGQQAFFSGLLIGRSPYLNGISTRHRSHGAGQSLKQYYGTVASSSTGLAADFADVRVFNPTLSGYLGGVGTTKRLNTTFNSSAIGGSSLISTAGPLTPDAGGGTSWAVFDGVTANKKFWWDQYNSIPGPCAQTWLANTVNAGGAAAYENTIITWAQGEQNASDWTSNGEAANKDQATYKASLIALFNWMRTVAGASAPIVIQPIGRQSGTDAYCRVVRRIEKEVSAEVANVVLSAETTHMTRQDTVHFGAGPADPDGFDRAAKQLAAAVAAQMGVPNMIWRGPEISAATLVDATTIDLTVQYPSGCGGTDIRTVDGSTTGMVGFAVTGKTVSGAARLNATTIRITGTGFTSGDLVQYNPTPAALDRLKMVVDNNSGLNMPLRHVFDLAAA